MVTARRIPVPEPIAPTKSAKIVRAPMHSPPKVAAVGMTLKIIYYFYFLNLSPILESLVPAMKYP